MKEKVLVLLGLVACLLLIIGFSGGFSSNDATTDDHSEENVSSAGESQEMSGLNLTLNGVSTEEKEDELIVRVDITVENNRSSSVNFSLMNVTLMDDEHYAYSHASNVDTKGILGGQIPADRAVSGEIAYIVPKGTEFELIYTDHFREGQLIFPIDLTN